MVLNPMDLNTIIPLFKNAVKNAGWVPKKSSGISEDAAWEAIAPQYAIGADGKIVNMREAASLFINDMRDGEDGTKYTRFSLAPDSSIVLHEDKNTGWLVSNWLSPNTFIRITKDFNSGEKAVVGPLGTYTGAYPDWHDFNTYAFSYCTDFQSTLATSRIWDGDINVPISFPYYYGRAVPVSYKMIGWRIVIQNIESIIAEAQYVNHLVYKEKKAVWHDSEWVTREKDVTSKLLYLGYFMERTIGTSFFFLPFPGIPQPHIGDDIKNVSSITGGHGADAWEPNPTRDLIGQGGNGGHGGGGGGAGGFCKQEVITGNRFNEIDLTQKIGNMVPGTGGAGTNGTAGHKGGCIIFY